MPEAGLLLYLIEALSEIGEAKFTGEVVSPIDWTDIKSWSDVTGADLNPGEANAIRVLSSAYVAQYYESLDKGCPPPNIERLKNREVVATKIKGLFSMLRGSDG